MVQAHLSMLMSETINNYPPIGTDSLLESVRPEKVCSYTMSAVDQEFLTRVLECA